MLTYLDLPEILERAIAEAGTAKAWAEKAGVTAAHLSHIRSGERACDGPKILRALGLRRVIYYDYDTVDD